MAGLNLFSNKEKSTRGCSWKSYAVALFLVLQGCGITSTPSYDECGCPTRSLKKLAQTSREIDRITDEMNAVQGTVADLRGALANAYAAEYPSVSNHFAKFPEGNEHRYDKAYELLYQKGFTVEEASTILSGVHLMESSKDRALCDFDPDEIESTISSLEEHYYQATRQERQHLFTYAYPMLQSILCKLEAQCSLSPREEKVLGTILLTRRDDISLTLFGVSFANNINLMHRIATNLPDDTDSDAYEYLSGFLVSIAQKLFPDHTHQQLAYDEDALPLSVLLSQHVRSEKIDDVCQSLGLASGGITTIDDLVTRIHESYNAKSAQALIILLYQQYQAGTITDGGYFPTTSLTAEDISGQYPVVDPTLAIPMARQMLDREQQVAFERGNNARGGTLIQTFETDYLCDIRLEVAITSPDRQEIPLVHGYESSGGLILLYQGSGDSRTIVDGINSQWQELLRQLDTQLPRGRYFISIIVSNTTGAIFDGSAQQSLEITFD